METFAVRAWCVFVRLGARSRRNSNKSEWIAIRITSDWFSQTEKKPRPPSHRVRVSVTCAAGKFNLENGPLTHLDGCVNQIGSDDTRSVLIIWWRFRVNCWLLAVFGFICFVAKGIGLKHPVNEFSHVNAYLSNCVNDKPQAATYAN